MFLRYWTVLLGWGHLRNFKLPQLVIFGNLFLFLFYWFVCMSKVILNLSFHFYSRLGLPSGRRYRFDRPWSWRGKINKQRPVLGSLLNLFWWPFLPLFHCEKECLSVPGIRRPFWVVFFLVGSTFSGYVRQENHQPIAFSRHRYTKVRFSTKNPPFYLKHVWSYAPASFVAIMKLKVQMLPSLKLWQPGQGWYAPLRKKHTLCQFGHYLVKNLEIWTWKKLFACAMKKRKGRRKIREKNPERERERERERDGWKPDLFVLLQNCVQMREAAFCHDFVEFRFLWANLRSFTLKGVNKR